jgi:hypothetical protein
VTGGRRLPEVAMFVDGDEVFQLGQRGHRRAPIIFFYGNAFLIDRPEGLRLRLRS